MSSAQPGLNEAIAPFVSGHAVARKVFARGVQVYEWEGGGWRLADPLADLYELEADDRPGTQKAGTHYVHLSTPAWGSSPRAPNRFLGPDRRTCRGSWSC